MPDVKEETEVVEAEEPQKGTPAKSRDLTQLLTKVAMFGIIALVAVFAAYIITLKVLKPMTARTPTPVVEEHAPVAEEAHGQSKESGGHGGGHGGQDAGNSDDAKFHTIENVVVNPAGTAGTRFLSCSISFEVLDSDEIKVLERKDVQIRDILITILSSKTVDELSNIKSRNRMRREILSIVNKMITPSKVKAVYLTDFVLQ